MQKLSQKKTQKIPDVPRVIPGVPVSSTLPHKPLSGSRATSFLWIAGSCAVIVFSLLGGIGLLVQRERLDALPEPALPEPTTQQYPTPTPVFPDFSAYPIDIRNGSGIKGDAARAKLLLEQARFVVGSIGNAQTSDYPKTVIRAPESVPMDIIEKIITQLNTVYTVSAVPEIRSGSDRIEIILGTLRK